MRKELHLFMVIISLILSGFICSVAGNSSGHVLISDMDGYKDRLVNDTVYSVRRLREMNVVPHAKSVRHNVAPMRVGESKWMYAYLLYDEVIYERLMCRLDIADPGHIEAVEGLEYEYYPDIVSGAYGNGLYYFYGCNMDGYARFFASADIDNRTVDIINDYEVEPVVIVNDMTYDCATSTMYVSANDDFDSPSDLYKVDLATGNMELVAGLDDMYLTIAATYDGQLYAISQTGKLVEIDKHDGHSTFVLDTGIYPAYTQSMEFDRMDGILYWASFTSDFVGNMIEIDIDAGTVENLGEIGEYAQISGLYIPYVEGNVNAPGTPSGFAAVPYADGSGNVSLSWTNPSLTLGGQTLESIDAVDIYRNEALLVSFDDVRPGEDMEYEDTDVPSGNTVYRIGVSNSEGESPSVEVQVYVGHDVPDSVTSLTLTSDIPNTARLSWQAPQRGLNGGWMDTASLRYKVTRFPDNTVVAEGLTATVYEDAGLENLCSYSYAVEASNNDGIGGTATSNALLIGTAVFLPYTSSFAGDEQQMWTLLDADGNDHTWSFSKLVGKYWFDGDDSDAAFYFGNATGSTDDWLVSSPVRIVGAESYEISFDNRVSRKGEQVVMEISIGTGTDISGHSILYSYTITDYEVSRFRLALPGLEDGDYCFGLHLADAVDARLQIKNLEIKSGESSRMTGDVMCSGIPLDGVSVVISDGETVVAETKTAHDGHYDIPYVESGVYTVSVSLAGYKSISRTVDFSVPRICELDFEMQSDDMFALTGEVLDEAGNPLDRVAVTLNNGSVRTNVSTLADGTFAVEDLVPGEYRISFFRNGFEQYDTMIYLDSDKSLGTSVLLRKVLPPSSVVADRGVVEWDEPVEYRQYRYDSGIPYGDPFGFNGGHRYSVLGTVFRQSAGLVSVSWFTVDDGYDDHDYVNLFVFDVEPDGTPTSRILFEQEHIQNTPGEWVSFRLPEQLMCSNGFMVALSVDEGYLSLGADCGNDAGYPFRENTYCSTEDFENKAFYYLEENGYRNNFMIRAEAVPFAAPYEHAGSDDIRCMTEPAAGYSDIMSAERMLCRRAPLHEVHHAVSESVPYPEYVVYRMKDGDEGDENLWTCLTAQPVGGLTMQDTGWDTLADGYYRYAVKAVYTGGRYSQALISDAAGKGVSTDVNISVRINTDRYIASGATVRLSSSTEEYTVYTDGSGNAVFEGIMKGEYRAVVMMKGCEDYSADYDFSTEGSYSEDVMMTERIVTPQSPVVEKTGDSTYTLSWNMLDISDDFEGHADFAVDSSGDAGWIYIDGDGSQTAGFLNSETSSWYKFDNMFSPMAYIVFNPSATEPAMTEDAFDAHSGEKYIASLTSELQNDDYFISPVLDGTAGITFRFYANSVRGLDYMSVGYSFTGTDSNDIIWMDEHVSVSEGWNEYVYDMPAGVRHTVIRCDSYRGMAFMIDDVCIMRDAATSVSDSEGIGSHEYEVYLDGEQVSVQHGISFTFSDIEQGHHVAGVRAVYASGESQLQTVGFDVIGSGIVMDGYSGSSVDVYPNPVSGILYVSGVCDRAVIYDLSGREVLSVDVPAESVDVSGLVPGPYLIRLYDGDDSVVKKISVR